LFFCLFSIIGIFQSCAKLRTTFGNMDSGACGLRHYPPLQTFMQGRMHHITTPAAIGYNACSI